MAAKVACSREPRKKRRVKLHEGEQGSGQNLWKPNVIERKGMSLQDQRTSIIPAVVIDEVNNTNKKTLSNPGDTIPSLASRKSGLEKALWLGFLLYQRIPFYTASRR